VPDGDEVPFPAGELVGGALESLGGVLGGVIPFPGGCIIDGAPGPLPEEEPPPLYGGSLKMLG